MSVTGLAPAGVWRNKIYSGGWKAAGGGTIPVTEKATGEEMGSIGCASAATPGPQRGDALREVARLLRVHAGPIVNERQAANVDRIVAESAGKGAKILAGGSRDGLFHKPTVMVDVAPGMPVFEEEIFGPVAAVTVVKDDEEAVALANQNRYGLVAAVASSDLRRAQRVVDRLHAGIVHINDQTVMHEVFGPMGGLGMSGNGHNYSTLTNADQFTEWQWMTSRENLPAYPF
ncbi:aldehyde dehydrogenase family protein [Paraburkholderia sp. GAS32]|uniref:aldehyde dehydrogenase family protein n=1 Tax=Paraburkholderia sp. GAS32 TaxID=3035129 RepID=UPI003D238C2A